MNIPTILAGVYGNQVSPILRNSPAYNLLIFAILVACLLIGVANRKKIKNEKKPTISRKKCPRCGTEYAAYLSH